MLRGLPGKQHEDGESRDAVQVHGRDPLRVRVRQAQVPGHQLEREQRNECNIGPRGNRTALAPHLDLAYRLGNSTCQWTIRPQPTFRIHSDSDEKRRSRTIRPRRSIMNALASLP